MCMYVRMCVCQFPVYWYILHPVRVCVCVQQPDCYRGVVVDGLHSHFIQHPILATALVLKALGDRKHLYFVNLTFTYEAHLARLEAMEKEEERRRGLCASASPTTLTLMAFVPLLFAAWWD